MKLKYVSNCTYILIKLKKTIKSYISCFDRIHLMSMVGKISKSLTVLTEMFFCVMAV